MKMFVTALLAAAAAGSVTFAFDLPMASAIAVGLAFGLVASLIAGVS